MKTVCCFGELLLRFAPNNNWIGNNSMPVFIGGAELNTATALANWHIPVKYVTALPDNYISNQVLKEISNRNIDTTGIIFSGNKIGCYYLPVGSELKNTGVIYDRNNSSFAELKPGTINWEKVFKDCSWFHFSAITPAVSENAAAICKEAVEIASAKGLTISVDLNYRNKLWQYGKQPADIMPDLLKYCHVMMGNIWATESLLNIPSPVKISNGQTKEELWLAANTSIQQLKNQYPLVSAIAYTFRLEKSYWAVLRNSNGTVVSKEYGITGVADKVGSGDCFMAGLIYGLYNNYTDKDIVDFAAAAAKGKLNECGDATKQTINDIKKQ
ncbi:MAG: sugar kinase [Sphingobacteriales bacterium]|nr:MAG: sugar kinase [Sphingobacteriales bacterium]